MTYRAFSSSEFTNMLQSLLTDTLAVSFAVFAAATGLAGFTSIGVAVTTVGAPGVLGSAESAGGMP